MPLTITLNGWYKRSIGNAEEKIHHLQQQSSISVGDALRVLNVGRVQNEILVIVDGKNIPPHMRDICQLDATSHVSITPWYAHLSLRNTTSQSRK